MRKERERKGRNNQAKTEWSGNGSLCRSRECAVTAAPHIWDHHGHKNKCLLNGKESFLNDYFRCWLDENAQWANERCCSDKVSDGWGDWTRGQIHLEDHCACVVRRTLEVTSTSGDQQKWTRMDAQRSITTLLYVG